MKSKTLKEEREISARMGWGTKIIILSSVVME